eukprot:jgi/Chlat1/302/Chrsp1S03062
MSLCVVRRGFGTTAAQLLARNSRVRLKPKRYLSVLPCRPSVRPVKLSSRSFRVYNTLAVGATASCREMEEQHSLSSITLQDDSLQYHSNVILESVAKNFYATDLQYENSSMADTDSPLAGVILGAKVATPKAYHDVPLGRLRCRRTLGLGRIKIWWMQPTWGAKGANIPSETQLLLAELEEGGPYAAILPLIDASGFRATLHDGEGTKDKGWLTLRIESGCPQTMASDWSSLIAITASSSPYEAISAAVELASKRLKTFRTLKEKTLPPWLDYFGWCTWDAFYYTVCAQDIPAGLRTLNVGGTPAKFVIIDDGWQSVQVDPQYRKQLSNAMTEAAVDHSLLRKLPQYLLRPLQVAGNYILGLGTKGVQLWYDNLVAPAPNGSLRVKAWILMAHYLLRAPLLAHYAQVMTLSKRLVSVRANTKFAHIDAGREDGESTPEEGGGLKAVVKNAKEVHGAKWMLAWHAFPGYWGGVSPHSEDTKKYDPSLVAPNNIPAIIEYEPHVQWDPTAMGGVGVVPPERVADLYKDMHSYLANAGIDGLKVDVQAGVGAMGTGYGGGSSLVKRYTEALETSVKRHFPEGSVMGCMCHSTENLMHYMDTPVARASDDFYPRVEASHSAHIVGVAYNSLLIGEIAQPDWDMFHSKHPAAGLHAAARAVGGTALYVSDVPGEHDFDLLKKVWNHNKTGGVLAAFNVQGASWDRTKRAFTTHDPQPPTLEATLSPRDVEQLSAFPETGIYAVHQHSTDQLHIMPIDGKLQLKLKPLEYEIVSVTPVYRKLDVQFAAVGLADMFNGGGAVLAQELVSHHHKVSATITARGCGRFVCHTNISPVGVCVNGAACEFTFDEATQRLEFLVPFVEADSVAIGVLW